MQETNRNNDASCNENYQEHIPWSFAYKIVGIDDRFSKPVVLYRGKNTVNSFIAAILNEYEYCRRVIKKILTKISS